MSRLLSLPRVTMKSSLWLLLLGSIGCDQASVFLNGLAAVDIVDERRSLKVSAMRPVPVSSRVQQHVFFGSLAASSAEVLGFGRSGRIATISERGTKFQEGETIAEVENDDLRTRRDMVAQQLQGGQEPAQARRLQIQLADLNRQIAAGQIKAPFDGVVARSFLAVGEVVQERRPVVQLYQDNRPIIVADVPIADAKLFTESADLRCLFPEKSIPCRVRSLSSGVDRTGTVEARLGLESDMDGVDWSYGQTIEVRLTESLAVDAFAVPAASIASSVSTPWSVLRIDSTAEGAHIRRVAVELIQRQGESCLVTGDLEGTTIVASGTHRVVAGQLVDPVDRSAEFVPSGK